jgi:hypothetical protein
MAFRLEKGLSSGEGSPILARRNGGRNKQRREQGLTSQLATLHHPRSVIDLSETSAIIVCAGCIGAARSLVSGWVEFAVSWPDSPRYKSDLQFPPPSG